MGPREGTVSVEEQPELLKPNLVQREQGVEATIVIFGSARLAPLDRAWQALGAERRAGDATAIKRADAGVLMSRNFGCNRPLRSAELNAA